MQHLRLFGGRAWDALTPAELRIVATAMTEASAAGAYTIEGVFLRMLVAVNDLDVLYANAEPNPDTGILEPIYWVRRRNTEEPPFPLSVCDLQYFCKPRKEGGGGSIDWLAAGSKRTVSPDVPRVHRRWGRVGAPRGFAAPAHRMADVTWQQYRAMTDYFDQYIRIDNAVRRARAAAQQTPSVPYPKGICFAAPKGGSPDRTQSAPVPGASASGSPASPAPPRSASPAPPSPLAGPEGDRLLAQARAQWLATIFTRRCLHRDPQRGTLTYSFAYRPGQATAHQHYFLRVDPVDFQLVLLWWEGMQSYLQQRYPKCFKRGAPAPSDRQDPLSLYSRSIATLEKFTSSDEATINQKTYTVILQQFNDMVEQNEEYERMRT